MFNNHASTINFTLATDNYQERNSVIDFKALMDACWANNGLQYDVQEIFAHVSSFLFWTAVQVAQRAGITSDTIAFIQQNRGAWLERPEYVENRILSSLSKVIRCSCSLNMRVSQYGMNRFLTVKFNRDEKNYYSMADARKLSMDIANAYEKYLGISILETNWNSENSKLVR